MTAPQVSGSCTLLMVSLNLFNFSLRPAAENSPRVLFPWSASFLLAAESACAEVGLCYLDASQTSCSAPFQIARVYLENHLCSTKGKKCFLWHMQEDSSGGWWLDSCLGKERCLGTASRHESQGVPFGYFQDCHALCSELVPNVHRGLPCMKWGLRHWRIYTVFLPLLCISLLGSDSAHGIIHLTPAFLPWNV